MAEAKDSVLDKAESLARRILERLGSKVDSRLAPDDQQVLSPRAIGDLASRIEQLIESSRRDDEHGVKRVVPNRFKVLLTYEETSNLAEQYIEAAGKELTATTFEYVNNHRYVTRGPVEVQVSRDLFAKATLVKATFEGDAQQPTESSQTNVVPHTEEANFISFATPDGRSYRLELKAESAPAYIGRAAGNAVRLDDPSVSRLHCSLSLRRTGTIVIADVGSANGTYVNEQLLASDEARPLKLGDVVGVGDFRLTVSEIS